MRTARPPAATTSLETVMLAYGLSRLVVVTCGWLAVQAWGVDPAAASPNWQPFGSSWSLVDLGLRFDAQWYLTIARDGYGGALDIRYFDMRPNFMPLFPMMIRALAATGIPLVASGLTLANAGTVIGLACLHQLVAREGGTRLATRVVWIVALFPSSLFLSSVYREGPLMAWTMGAWLAASLGRAGIAGLLALGASITSAFGAVVLVPLALIGWRTAPASAPSQSHVALRYRSLTLLLAPSLLGLAGYLWWADRTWGDALMLVKTQQAYRGPSTWPWMSLVTWWQHGPGLHGYANSSIDAMLVAGSLAATGWLFRRRPPEYGLFALAAVLVPLSSGLVSFSRMLLAAPVLAIPVAASLLGARIDTPTNEPAREGHRDAAGLAVEATRVRPSWMLLGWLATSLLGLAWFAARFATWQWVA